MKSYSRFILNLIMIIYTSIGIFQFVKNIKLNNVFMTISSFCILVSGIVFLFILNFGGEK